MTRQSLCWRVPGHPPGDTFTGTSCRQAASFMPVTAVVLKLQDGSHTSKSQMHTPHDAASGFFRVIPSFPATINPGVSSLGGLLPDPSIPPIHAGSHTQPPLTHTQPGSLVTWVHNGLRVTWSHVVAHRQAHTLIQGHTQAHTVTWPHTVTWAHTGSHTGSAHTGSGHTCSTTPCCWHSHPSCLHANSCP